MEEEIRTFEGREYDHNFMMDIVNIYDNLKRKLEDARQEIDLAKAEFETAKEDFEFVELEYNNKIGEWEGFEPFEEALRNLKGSGKNGN